MDESFRLEFFNKSGKLVWHEIVDTREEISARIHSILQNKKLKIVSWRTLAWVDGEGYIKIITN